ncbi:NAD+ kinase [Dyella sp. OK004]|uniref:NAD kinase n=1 Tax=Dyella sp. OK004 TaxID=1855292 RepID=UPI0008EFE7A2|nr:NAD kinase [Dyella sp. OK004]SFS19260.1 NAD+ kinase [Dyella sp. OK004]
MAYAFVASETSVAQQARRKLVDRYGDTPPEQAEAIVALGGDGFMLRTLHAYRALPAPVYGMKLGRVGFLMNKHRIDDLDGRITRAHAAVLYPLEMQVTDVSGEVHQALAFNEVSLLRQSNQAAHLEVQLNEAVKLDALVCDGILVSTPAGSTAYNLSAHGPILPLDANVLALTPISPFRPRRWRGAILPHRTQVTLRVLDPGKRPVSATADFHEVRDVRDVVVKQSEGPGVRLLFDPEHNLEQRILDEQFAPD